MLHRCLVQALHWPDPVARMVWQVWVGAPAYAPLVAATHRATASLAVQDALARERATQHYLQAFLTKRVLVDTLEHLVTQGEVDRQSANALEAVILAQLDTHGHWKR